MRLFKTINTGSLIGKYLAGKETVEESDQLKQWLSENAHNRTLFEDIKQKKNIAMAIEEFDNQDKKLAWEKYKNRISALSMAKKMLRWKIAAMFFFLIGCSGILAYLTQYNSSSNILDETYTKISTSNGQNSKIILPDSSVVWINSGTTLSYNTNFSAVKREIRLVGQAYFQIAKNTEKPLTVICNNLEVKVLGTKFDVSAYSNENQIRVVLESGKVELLNAADKSLIYVMKPGEKADFDTDNKKLLVRNVDAKDFAAWKDGFLVFKNEKMDVVFKQLERWYDIEIDVKDERVKDLVFNATIVNENIEEIFELIWFSCGINYKIIPSRNPEVPIKVIISKK